MPVTALLDTLGTHLGATLGAGTAVGVARPSTAGELPAVTLSLPEVEPTMASVGRQPAPTQTGALRVERALDLADPALDFDGERVTLLSADRLTLQLPHGPVVRADGIGEAPFTVADLTIRLGGTTFTPVTGTPAAGQCRPDPDTGVVTFAGPLPATGVLQLGYFVGQWEVHAERYAGSLLVESFAGSVAAVQTLSNQVVAALHRPVGVVDGLRRLDPAAVGAIAPSGVGNSRTRAFTFRFDFEAIDVVLPTGGGPIGRVAVDSEMLLREVAPGVLEIDPEGHEAFTIPPGGN